MSATTGAHVYTGAWINWSRGHVLGPTLTLTSRNGGLLTAFLGIFVTIAGAACWRILCFIIHQWRAEKGSKNDALYHQQQAILRNSSSPGAAAWQMSQVAWSWKSIARNPVLRNLPLVILAILNMSLFGLAGVFSSEISKAAGNETLLRSPNCGTLMTYPEFPEVYRAVDANQTLAAAAYSRACYGSDSDDLTCNRYPRRNIQFTTKPNAHCPVDDALCALGPNSAFEVESKLIDSHEDLGINAKKSERIQFRKTTSCTIVPTVDYAQYENDTAVDGYTAPFVRYYYGCYIEIDDFNVRNFTYGYNTAAGFNSAVGYVLT